MSRKLFVGGLSWNTTDEGLRGAFARYGVVVEAKVVTDRETGRSRGFGFVAFQNPADGEAARQAMSGWIATMRGPTQRLASSGFPCMLSATLLLATFCAGITVQRMARGESTTSNAPCKIRATESNELPVVLWFPLPGAPPWCLGFPSLLGFITVSSRLGMPSL